jgi:hypothetical protein
MNWARNNRFLAGYLVVMVIGICLLGFLLYSSYGRYSEVSAEYHTQVTELQRLQHLTPYPDARNLQSYVEVKKSYSVAVADLQRQLAAMEPPPEVPPPTPLQFQDRLRRVVDEVSKSAQQFGVTLPDDFYLGFEQYRGALPDTAVTPALSAELDAIRDLLEILIKERIQALTLIKRAPLPHETGGGASPEPGRPGRPNLGPPPAPNLVTRNAVELEFTCLPNPFRESLNRITAASRLYLVTALRVKNEVDIGPPRGGGDQTPGGAPANPRRDVPPPPPGAPAADQNGVPTQPLPEKGPPELRYVVGLERITVAARIDLVKVAPPR